MTKVAVELRSGMDFGPYRVDMLQGRGGSCQVYRAHHRATGRAVALKVGRSDLTDAEHRLRREAELLMRADHPNVVRVLEHLVVDDTPALVTEWIEGPSLAEMVQDCGALGQEITADLARPIAGALDALHARGVVHRDLSLRNIMLDSAKGVPVLIDLGHGRSDEVTTTVDNAAGTPRYVAPEVIRGLMVDGRADQYSLAVILQELVTGESPFPETDNAAAALYQQLDARPTPMREADPGVPAFMEAAALRALEKAPEDRFESCTAFVKAFTGRAPKPVRAGFAAAAIRRTRAGLGSIRSIDWITAVVVLALLIGAVAAVRWFRNSAVRPELVASETPTTVAEAAVAFDAEGRSIATTSDPGNAGIRSDDDGNGNEIETEPGGIIPDPTATDEDPAGGDQDPEDDTGGSGSAGAPETTNTTDSSGQTPTSQSTSPTGPSPAGPVPAGPSPTAPTTATTARQTTQTTQSASQTPAVYAGQAAGFSCNLLAVPGFDNMTMAEDYFQRSQNETVVANAGIDNSPALSVGDPFLYGQYGERVLVTPGSTYGFTFQHFGTGKGTDRTMGIFFLDANWNKISSRQVTREIGEATDWRQVTIYSEPAPTNAVRAVPWVENSGGGDLFIVDEMLFARVGGCADGFLGRGR